MLYVLLKYLIKPFFWLVMRPVIFGRENLYVKGKAIFVCNHISLLDPVCIALVTPRLVHFMAKAELFSSWISSLFFKGLLAFPVHRNQIDIHSLKKAADVLAAGRIFGIFPEGKRTITNETDELEKGAAFLASRSGAPIIPIFIRHDSYNRLRLIMAVGKPILATDLIATTPKGKVVDVLTDEICDAFYSLQRTVETY